jgi:hypothetical protein
MGRRGRFLRDGAILAGLDHPAIVRYVTQRISSEGESYQHVFARWIR